MDELVRILICFSKAPRLEIKWDKYCVYWLISLLTNLNGWQATVGGWQGKGTCPNSWAHPSDLTLIPPMWTIKLILSNMVGF